ncbi:type II secretion system protein [Oceanobacter kriegii]|uniref:type II secretion system protein n=1 Tax=Oceanobacter kriegii TaxID=64972 RepID=UPI00041C43AF|nr:type II secretion system protein [Oceanobacter kriegii]
MTAQPRIVTAQRGFTLIEMIMVIVILGIISLISMRFVGLYVQGWVDTGARATLSSAAYVASEQMSRDIRRALPNSVRAFNDGGNACLELVPIRAMADYLSLPVGESSTEADVVVVQGMGVGDSAYVAVYPTSIAAVYGASGSGPSVSDATAVLGAVSNNTQTLTFSSLESFPYHSPARRLYLVDTPIAWCEDGAGRLWRYANYGFALNSAALLPTTDASLLVDNLLPGSLRFEVAAAQLQRNAIVHLEFRTLRARRDGNTDGNGGEQMIINREVQLLNVP